MFSLSSSRSVRLALSVFAVLAPTALAAPARGDVLHLRSGDVLRGTIVASNGGVVVLEHPDLGRISIPIDRIAPLPPPAAVSAPPTYASIPDSEPAPEAPGSADAVPTADSAEDSTEKPAEDPEVIWMRRLIVGGGFSHDDDGDKSRLNIRGRFERTSIHSEFRLNGSWLYGRDNGATDDNYATARINHRWLVPEDPIFIFAHAQYDFNEFRDWRHRATAHVGPGYRFELVKGLRTDLLAGIGVRKDFGSEDEDLVGEGLLGVDFRWQPLERHTLELSGRYFPGMNNNRSRYTIETDWSYLLDQELQLSFNISFDYEYDTDPDPGFPNDVYYLNFGLQMDF